MEGVTFRVKLHTAFTTFSIAFIFSVSSLQIPEDLLFFHHIIFQVSQFWALEKLYLAAGLHSAIFNLSIHHLLKNLFIH